MKPPRAPFEDTRKRKSESDRRFDRFGNLSRAGTGEIGLEMKLMRYCQRGREERILAVEKENRDAGTVVLADDKGRIVATGLPVIVEPGKLAPAELPSTYATPVELPS